MIERLEKWGRIVALVMSPIGLLISAFTGQWLPAFGFAVLLIAVGIGVWTRRRQAAEAADGDTVEWSPALVREVVDGADSRTVGVRRIRVKDRSLSLLDAVKLYDEAVLGR